ncbi:MAG: hypothetical protein GWP19_00530 [Planctomycetia bacterium]|nr:hypothetical protein [Planctomycetia bacterium]
MQFTLNPFTRKLDAFEQDVGPTGDLEYLTGDVGGQVSPSSHNIDLLGTSAQGLTVTGDPANNKLTWTVQDADDAGNKGVSTYVANDFITSSGSVSLEDSHAATVTTTDAQTQTIETIAIAEEYAGTFYAIIVGIDNTNTATVGGTISGTVSRYTGGAATLIGTPNIVIERAGGLTATTTFNVSVSGNNAIVQVIGEAGFTISWRCRMHYTYTN